MWGRLPLSGLPSFDYVLSYVYYNEEHTELITMVVQCPNCKTFTKPLIRGSIQTDETQRPTKLDQPVICTACDWAAIYEDTVWTDLI